MNYIQQLKAEKAGLEREVRALRDGIDDLRTYLHSDKFNCGDPSTAASPGRHARLGDGQSES